MVFCVKCGASLPDGAQVLLQVRHAVPAPEARARRPPTAAAPSHPQPRCRGGPGAQVPACGAPINPVFGEMVISCDYCGGSVTLGGGGWKEISKHTMLPLKVTDRAAVLKVGPGVRGLGVHAPPRLRGLEGRRCRSSPYVPFWVVPASASTTYQYQAVATSVGATVGHDGGRCAAGVVPRGPRGRRRDHGRSRSSADRSSTRTGPSRSRASTSTRSSP